MCILPDATPGNTPAAHPPAACRLPLPQRQHLALQALRPSTPAIGSLCWNRLACCWKGDQARLEHNADIIRTTENTFSSPAEWKGCFGKPPLLRWFSTVLTKRVVGEIVCKGRHSAW